MTRWSQLLLIVILMSFAATATTAMRHTSTTFDEILLPAGGARRFATGNFDLVTLFHPPVLQYLYGLPVALSGVTIRPRTRSTGETRPASITRAACTSNPETTRNVSRSLRDW